MPFGHWLAFSGLLVMRQLTIALAGFLLAIPLISFAALSTSDTGLTTTGNEAYDVSSATDIGTFTGKKIINPAFSMVGVVFLILVIYAGFLWMTAGGKSEQVTKARNILLAAIIGLIIIFSAYAITNFILDSLS
ncbi:hypothetical protein D6827_02075 [Candidatus Parcubacteria bacterium]|nr:MAG: hypothetical protein D6827_02075 [Candidatus Parcubacteria bacterium]